MGTGLDRGKASWRPGVSYKAFENPMYKVICVRLEIINKASVDAVVCLTCVENVPCQTAEYNRFNHSTSLLYISDFEITDIENLIRVVKNIITWKKS